MKLNLAALYSSKVLKAYCAIIAKQLTNIWLSAMSVDKEATAINAEREKF
ncbi:MAG: hypothetical protein ABID54_11080 [Pseudomonadota bacterium]